MKPGEELEALWGAVNDHPFRADNPAEIPLTLHGHSSPKSHEGTILGEPNGSVQILCRVGSAAKDTGNVPARFKVLTLGLPIILFSGEGQDGFLWSMWEALSNSGRAEMEELPGCSGYLRNPGKAAPLQTQARSGLLQRRAGGRP